MRTRDLTGPLGEALAAEYLRKKHYRIEAMNYRTRLGEIDIIASNRQYLVFCEVKLRKSADFAAAREFVDARSTRSTASPSTRATARSGTMKRCVNSAPVQSTEKHSSKNSMRTRDLSGPWGEALAAEYLRKKGWRIEAMNYRTRLGEIDIIASNRLYLVFCEVTLRTSADFAAAREFVDARKQQRLRTTALLYLSQHETPLQPRFDVIEIYAPDGTQTRRPQITHMEDAF